MSTHSFDFDVAVVGGSVAGCAAALFFSRSGYRVAVLERAIEPEAYKIVCTHFIQPGSAATIGRLGLDDILTGAGAIPNRLELHTPYGWIRSPADVPTGWNLRREVLDPLLRRITQSAPGVTWLSGHRVQNLAKRAGRVSGVLAQTSQGGHVSLSARLVVGADGRNSMVAQSAGVRERARANQRFLYYAYYESLPLQHGANSQYWHLDQTRNLAFAFANDRGTTLLGAFLPHDALPSWKRDVERHFRAFWREVPDAPDVDSANRVCDFRGMLKMPSLFRTPVAPGVALIGDAALCLDSIWGTGCGFALRSADWLHDAVGQRLTASNSVIDRGLRSYARRHMFETRARALHIADFSTARQTRWFEDLVFRAAAADPHVATALLSYLGCMTGVSHLLTSDNLLRIAAQGLRAGFTAQLAESHNRSSG
jgi:flavin-dependent dehydrogenase